MPLHRLPNSSSATRLRKPMTSTGPTHPIEHIMEQMPDTSKKAIKQAAKIQKKSAAARAKAIKKSGA